MNKRTRIVPAIGLILVIGNLIIGHYTSASNMTDFIRGLVLGIGIALMIVPFIKKKLRRAV